MAFFCGTQALGVQAQLLQHISLFAPQHVESSQTRDLNPCPLHLQVYSTPDHEGSLALAFEHWRRMWESPLQPSLPARDACIYLAFKGQWQVIGMHLFRWPGREDRGKTQLSAQERGGSCCACKHTFIHKKLGFHKGEAPSLSSGGVGKQGSHLSHPSSSRCFTNQASENHK